MTWIESHSTLRDHPKLRRLARTLGIDRRAATGLLHWIWWWAMDYAPDGDLSEYEDADIADGLDWDGDPAALMSALRDAGFIDGTKLHDWEEYGEKLYRKRQANAQRMKDKRAANVQRTCDTHSGHVGGLEDRTGQDKEDRTGQEEHSASTSDSATVVFDYWKTTMGRNGATIFDDKRKKAVKWALKNYDLETCLRAVDGYAASDWHMGRDPKTGGKKNNDLTLIFRDADHVERFLSKPKTGCEMVDEEWGGDED